MHKSSFGSGQRIFAWSVHAFTMTGVLWAVLALLAVADQKIKYMWLWLAIALFVDGIDGTLARKARVKEVIPWFDGVILDDIVDYMTWTFIPGLFMYRYLPMGPKPLAMVMLIVILASSMFCYCNVGMKSKDYYFVGFPAAWNIVALYFYLLGTPAWFNIAAIAVFSALTLSTVTFLHPFRVRSFMVANLVATASWLGLAAALVVMHPGISTGPYPQLPVYTLGGSYNWLLGAWALPAIWFTIVGIWRTIKGRPLDKE